MNRRQFISTVCVTSISSIGGCTSYSSSHSNEAEISELEVWNSDDENHVFYVTLFDTAAEQIFEQTVELSGSSESHYTRKILSDTPDSAAKIRAEVGDETDEKELTGHESPVLISVKYDDENRLGIATFV